MRLIIAVAYGLLGMTFASHPILGAQDRDERQAELVPVPDELKLFSGMMIGRLVDRDIEQGSFTVTIDYVARVWRNNEARQPRSAVGKTLRVEGITGEWLDHLLLVRPGETLEFEAQHRAGDSLRFPGEWLKKVEPFDPANHPVPPNDFRGFAGIVRGEIEAKRVESRELVLRITGIERTHDGNRAEEPEAVIDQEIILAGFWAQMSEPFDEFSEGDTIRAGVLHRVRQSDHFSVHEFAEKVDQPTPDQTINDATSDESRNTSAIPEGMQGFRGILEGTLVSRDVEEGELVFRALRATRVWRANRATDLESCRDVTFVVKGISGKWLDVLITLEPGQSIGVEAFHNGSDHLDFVGEYLTAIE